MSVSEHRVAAPDDIADGEMRQVDAGGTAVLLSRVGGRFYATTAHCTHYGAPLATGLLAGTTVVCPWHHAVFDVTSGALCGPPAADALRTFSVRVDEGGVFVSVPADADEHGKGVDYRTSDGRLPEMAEPSEEADERVFVILGGGAAGQAAAEMLRHEGFQGRIVMATPEAEAPYDRTKLSKAYLAGGAGDDALPLRDARFYERFGIDLLPGTEATRLDPAAQTVTLTGRPEPLRYDGCLVATGATPRALPVPGGDLPGVLRLRSHADAQALVAQAEQAERVVVVGASFIGMETAASLRARGKSVTVVAPEEVPFGSLFGDDVGAVFQRAAEAKGIAFQLNRQVRRIEEKEGALEVRLSTGAPLPADLVLVGIGVVPNTGFLNGTADLSEKGGIRVDARLRLTGADGKPLGDGLFAAGDVARYPEVRLGTRVRIEHWRLAQQHGRHAARAFLAGDAAEPFTAVPYFWSGQNGLSLRYAGHADAFDEVVVRGTLEGDKPAFAAYYVQGGRAVAVAGIGRDKEVAAFHALLAHGQPPSPDTLRGDADLVALASGLSMPGS